MLAQERGWTRDGAVLVMPSKAFEGAKVPRESLFGFDGEPATASCGTAARAYS
jgi:hypothetical protein